MNRTASPRRQARGFTLVELCVGVGIGATLLGQAIPAMTQLRQEQLLRATADTLAADLRFARSEAARLGEAVHFRVSARGAQACYLLHTGAPRDCDCAGGQAACKSTDSAVLKAEWLPAQQPLTLSSNAETLQFQHRQGLVTQTGSVEVALENGPGIRQVIAITGRVRSCSTGGKLGRLPRC
ncbi:MAG: GspH/FimT family pseudopilin [Roseateles sp.]|uniref:GspH/FimT family pseudopilin n=1 Tax=Roseateles sp. TaxID=1971397 RepID=UPI0039EB3B9C